MDNARRLQKRTTSNVAIPAAIETSASADVARRTYSPADDRHEQRHAEKRVEDLERVDHGRETEREQHAADTTGESRPSRHAQELRVARLRAQETLIQIL